MTDEILDDTKWKEMVLDLIETTRTSEALRSWVRETLWRSFQFSEMDPEVIAELETAAKIFRSRVPYPTPSREEK